MYSITNATNHPTSALSGLEAVEVFFRLFEVVDRGCACSAAVGAPLPVFLLALWAPCRARCISVDVVSTNLVDFMQVHAALCEQVLTPWLVACDLLAALVIQSLLAIIEVGHVCGCGIVAENFKAAKEAEIDKFAILKVDTVRGHLDLAQPVTEPRGQENGINIDLHGPILVVPLSSFLDHFPGRDENVRVDPCPGLFPLGKVEIIIVVIDLDSVDRGLEFGLGADPCFHIAVDLPGFTSEDACMEEHLSPQQVEFVRFFCGASVLRVEGEAEECVLRPCYLGLVAFRVVSSFVASPILSWNALLHALGKSCMDLIASVACGLAAPLGDAVGPNLCALITWWDHKDRTEPKWGHAFGEGLGRHEVRTCGEAHKQECTGGAHCQCNLAPALGTGSYIVIAHFLVGFHHDC